MPNNNRNLYEFDGNLYDQPDIGWYIIICAFIDGEEKTDIYKIIDKDNRENICYGEYIDRHILRTQIDPENDGIYEWDDAYYYDLDRYGRAGEYWADTYGFPSENTIIWNEKPMIVTFRGKYTIDLVPYHKNNTEQIIFTSNICNE